MAKSIDDEIAFRSWLGQRLAGAGWFVLIAGFLLALPVLLGLDPMVLVVIAVVAGILAVLWVLLRRRVSVVARTGQPGPQWVRATLILTGTLGILAALPVYAMAVVSETRPVMMPQVVLSDGTRTVTFQGMVHVGTEAFYKSVVYDLERARADGYALYFEGVQPSTPEADRWFAETLAGGADLNVAYDAVAQTCGLKFQSDYFAFLEAGGGRRPRPPRHRRRDHGRDAGRGGAAGGRRRGHGEALKEAARGGARGRRLGHARPVRGAAERGDRGAEGDRGDRLPRGDEPRPRQRHGGRPRAAGAGGDRLPRPALASDPRLGGGQDLRHLRRWPPAGGDRDPGGGGPAVARRVGQVGRAIAPPEEFEADL